MCTRSLLNLLPAQENRARAHGTGSEYPDVARGPGGTQARPGTRRKPGTRTAARDVPRSNHRSTRLGAGRATWAGGRRGSAELMAVAGRGPRPWGSIFRRVKKECWCLTSTRASRHASPAGRPLGCSPCVSGRGSCLQGRGDFPSRKEGVLPPPQPAHGRAGTYPRPSSNEPPPCCLRDHPAAALAYRDGSQLLQLPRGREGG